MVLILSCFKKYRKILFDETLYSYIDITYLKCKGTCCMAEKPSHLRRVSLCHIVEIGLRSFQSWIENTPSTALV
jgi:hypothetical protein